MEKTSLNTELSSFSFLLLPHVLIYTTIIFWVIGINIFFTRLWLSLQSRLECDNSEIWEEKKIADFEEFCCSDKNRDDGSLCIEEVEMVMGRLELFCSKERGEDLEWSKERLLGLFESKEPSLEEVKEAFDVFDLNRDGFIDTEELQRVLCSLGCKEAVELENCRRMMKTYDHNGDGMIDFKEFLRFMEIGFC
ncbi:calcium-binding protein CML45 [Tripterygium wilfordii]|uniref:Calcium-binding protein CML45 n=1 Tax=Tripterygium wilfordii TaxID=458696 RepID=A0A7J7BZB7_TRIWF|nr:probable calcium-binding protein CML46 [Tripterygium wilfordii]KAF5726967.1 calcium-binding protein CML45 [Tripterygium wilfordii]